MDTPAPSHKVAIIKNIYFYAVSLVALLMVVFSFADVVNIALRTYVFTKADQNYYGGYYPACPVSVTPDAASSTGGKGEPGCVNKDEQQRIEKDNAAAQKQRDLVRDISLILVGVPLFLYHWHIIRKRDM